MSWPIPSHQSLATRLIVISVGCVLWPASAEAVPPGRAWLPATSYQVPGHGTFIPERLEVGPHGIPFAIATAKGGIGTNVYSLGWADTAWTVSWSLGAGGHRQWPVNAPLGRFPLMWNGLEIFGPEGDEHTWLTMAERLPDGTIEFDTVAAINYYVLPYAAAVTERRRWAVVDNGSDDLRLFTSDAPHDWQDIPVVGNASRGVTVSALDDTTALVAWAGLSDRLRWGVQSGSTWSFGGFVPYPIDLEIPGSPRLRPRPSGGQWMVWATDEPHMGVSTFRDGVWSESGRITCNYLRTFGHYTKSADLSRDGGEYPVVAWIADDAVNLVPTVCVCVPTDSGFTVADNIGDDAYIPVVTRDRNGDVWAAWTKFRSYTTMIWTHTYVTATTTIPNVTANGAARTVSWLLSEPAPETWWAVLRARTNQPYEEIARVRAGHSQKMSWTDPNPPPGALRYRIRRESVDTRYLWESAPGFWPLPRFAYGNSPLRVAVGPRGIDVTELVFSAAPAGPLTIDLFDLQGRRVHRQSIEATGSGRDVFELGSRTLGQSVAPGVYFVRGTDAHERVSNAAKVVLLH